MGILRTAMGADAPARDDWAFLSPAEQARREPPPHAAAMALWLIAALITCGVAWAFIARVDMLARAEARVIPQGRVQQIASLEGGLLRELKVMEGQAVEAGDVLALLDPTRMEAQHDEGQARVHALMAIVARLEAESGGSDPPQFGEALRDTPHLVQDEMTTWRSRRRAIDESVAAQQRSAALVQRELAMAETMAARGLMSDVEVMRLRRQLNELRQQTQDRLNQFRMEASVELARARTELAAQQAQGVLRRDALDRTTLVSPVRGFVKNIRIPTVGGVVQPGAAVMEIVPSGDAVLVELRIKPDDIGYVREGQRVDVRLATYESSIYGTLRGRVQSVAPDAIGDGGDHAGSDREGTLTRALVRSDAAGLLHRGKLLPVRPGMVGVADIRVGRRSVASFVLQPVMRAREAFTER